MSKPYLNKLSDLYILSAINHKDSKMTHTWSTCILALCLYYNICIWTDLMICKHIHFSELNHHSDQVDLSWQLQYDLERLTEPLMFISWAYRWKSTAIVLPPLSFECRDVCREGCTFVLRSTQLWMLRNTEMDLFYGGKVDRINFILFSERLSITQKVIAYRLQE